MKTTHPTRNGCRTGFLQCFVFLWIGHMKLHDMGFCIVKMVAICIDAWLPLEGKCFESNFIAISEHFTVYRCVPILLHARANASTVCDIVATWLYTYIQDIRSYEYLGPCSCCCVGARCTWQHRKEWLGRRVIPLMSHLLPCHLPLPFGSNLPSFWLQLPIGVAVVKELFVRFHDEKAFLATTMFLQICWVRRVQTHTHRPIA